MAQQPLLIQNLVPGNIYSIVHRQGLLPTRVATLTQVLQGPQVPIAQFNNIVGEINPATIAAFRDDEWFFFNIAAPHAATAAQAPGAPVSTGGRRRKNKNTRIARKNKKNKKSRKSRK